MAPPHSAMRPPSGQWPDPSTPDPESAWPHGNHLPPPPGSFLGPLRPGAPTRPPDTLATLVGPRLLLHTHCPYSLPRRPCTHNPTTRGPRQGHGDPVGQAVWAPHGLLLSPRHRVPVTQPVSDASSAGFAEGPLGHRMPNVLPMAANDEQAGAPVVSEGAATRPARVLIYVVKLGLGPRARGLSTRLVASPCLSGMTHPVAMRPDTALVCQRPHSWHAWGVRSRCAPGRGVCTRRAATWGLRPQVTTGSAWKQLVFSTRGKKVDGHRLPGPRPSPPGTPLPGHAGAHASA